MRMYDLPDARGHFGPYGGVFVAETLMHALDKVQPGKTVESVTLPAAGSAPLHIFAAAIGG